MWNTIKQAASKTVDTFNAINDKFDDAELYMFGQPIDEKIDVLYDRMGNAIMVKARGASKWTSTRFTRKENI